MPTALDLSPYIDRGDHILAAPGEEAGRINPSEALSIYGSTASLFDPARKVVRTHTSG